MSLALPKFRVGDPLCHEALAEFPLFTEPSGQVDYRLADAALDDKTLIAEEVDEDGSVPDLLVENRGDMRVLFVEGEDNVGANQNRALNTSVLAAACSKIRIPVSCVEQRRWDFKSRYFRLSGSLSPSKLRRALRASVTKSVKAMRGYRSDQAEVCREVACLHAVHGVTSDTAAMSDAFDTYRDRLSAFRERLESVAAAAGLAIAIGDRLVSVDLFDKPATCRKLWDRLLSGVVFDALEAGPTANPVSTSDVEQLLQATGDLPWEQTEAVGEGAEYRAESDRGDHASALTLGRTLVHGSLIVVL